MLRKEARWYWLLLCAVMIAGGVAAFCQETDVVLEEALPVVESPGGFPWLYVFIALGSFVVGATVGFILAQCRRKKQEKRAADAAGQKIQDAQPQKPPEPAGAASGLCTSASKPSLHGLNRIIDQINKKDPNAKLKRLDPHNSKNWSKTIQALQKYLGTNPDGKFGKNSINAYLKWAKRNGLTPVPLTRICRIKDVIGWLMKHSRATNFKTPSLGIWLALIFHESGFDTLASPFWLTRKSTATGLLQITFSTALDILRMVKKWFKGKKLEEEQDLWEEYGWKRKQPNGIVDLLENPEFNILLGLLLFYFDLEHRYKGDWRKALGRWEAWTNKKKRKVIEAKAKKIDAYLDEWKKKNPGKTLLDLDEEAEKKILEILKGK